MIEIDDFILLGTTVPQSTTKYTAAVCSAGYSPQLGALIRIYPLAMQHIPRRWDIYQIQLERPDKGEDSRPESWKIAGLRTDGTHSTINRRFQKAGELVRAERRSTLAPLVIPSIAHANDQRLSLGIIYPNNATIVMEKNEASADAPQLQLFSTGDKYEERFGHKTFPLIPRIQFVDAAGPHSLKLLDWGVYELMRKHPKYATPKDITKALSLDSSSALLVGNLNHQRNAWIVISVLADIRDESLFDVDSYRTQADKDRAQARRQRPLVAAAYGTDCYICGIPVDMDAMPDSPASPTIDHIIPLASGGSNDLENLRITHRRCNSSKGIGVA